MPEIQNNLQCVSPRVTNVKAMILQQECQVKKTDEQSSLKSRVFLTEILLTCCLFCLNLVQTRSSRAEKSMNFQMKSLKS